MKLIFETVYDVNKVRNLILKDLTKFYFNSCGGYGISKKEQTDFAREDALKQMNSFVEYSDEFLQEVADFLNSISYPVTVYRGLATDNINDIKTGIKSGVHWTIDPEYIKNQTNLLRFKYVMIGKFNEQDIDFEKVKEANLSDSALYFLAGNSIVVSVLIAIFGKLFVDDSSQLVNDYVSTIKN